MFWALLCPIQVSFQVQVGPKMGDLWLKNSQKWQDAILSKKSTWKLDNGPKHTPSNWERCFGHFYAPSWCHSRSRWVRKWVVLGVKNSQNDRMPYWAKKQPGNWIMNQNTHQAMGKDVLGTFMPHPGVIPGPGRSRNKCFWTQKQPKWQGAILEEIFIIQPGNGIMGQNTPQAIGKDVLGTFMPHPGIIPGPGGSKNGWFMAQI